MHVQIGTSNTSRRIDVNGWKKESYNFLKRKKIMDGRKKMALPEYSNVDISSNEGKQDESRKGE